MDSSLHKKRVSVISTTERWNKKTRADSLNLMAASRWSNNRFTREAAEHGGSSFTVYLWSAE